MRACVRACARVRVCMALLIGDLRFCVLVQQGRYYDDVHRPDPPLYDGVPH